MGLRVLAAGIAAVVLSGCSGDSETIGRASLGGLVLQPQDLAAQFVQFDSGAQGITDVTSRQRTDGRRFGRIDGWKARYRRPGTPTTPGVLVVESRVDLFEQEAGAEQDFAAYRAELEAVAGGRPLEVGGLGDEAAGVTFVDGRVLFYRVAWRFRNVTALVFANGFDGRLELGDVLALARRQQARLERADG